MNDLHGLLFAYRADANLGELTRPRNTCSLPFGGRYRLIDFMLSNYVNAGISDVGIIVHQNYQSLLDHLGSGKDWDLSRKHGGLRILPPFSYARRGGDYRGPMDALAGVSDYLNNIRQDYVILGRGDVALNLPVADVFQQHLDSGADVTVVCTPTLRGAPRSSEYVEVSESGRITDLSIHPIAAGDQLESLELYVLSKQLLLSMVDYCAAHDVTDFSRGVLQPRLDSLKLIPYVHKGYVGRFQSVDDYYHRSMDLLDPAVRADLFNPQRHPHQGPVQPLHLLRPQFHLHLLPGVRWLPHRGGRGKFHHLPRCHHRTRGQGGQQRPHAGNGGQGRCLSGLRHRRQKRHSEPGTDAYGPQHLSPGHRQGFRRVNSDLPALLSL